MEKKQIYFRLTQASWLTLWERANPPQRAQRNYGLVEVGVPPRYETHYINFKRLMFPPPEMELIDCRPEHLKDLNHGRRWYEWLRRWSVGEDKTTQKLCKVRLDIAEAVAFIDLCHEYGVTRPASIGALISTYMEALAHDYIKLVKRTQVAGTTTDRQEQPH